MDFLRISQATLRLFKAIYVEKENNIALTEDDIMDTASKGILLSSDVLFDSTDDLNIAIQEMIKIYGTDLFKLSKTFHKTWKTVQEIDPSLHYLQQLVHYLSTYGLDYLGISYDGSHAFIPKEKIPYPEDIVPFNFTLIDSIDLFTLDDRLNILLESGVALSQQQIDDIICLLDFTQSKGCIFNIDNIKNKEIKSIVWSKLKNKPYINVDEFLRVLVYKTTKSSLLIRSYRDFKNIKHKMDSNKEIREDVNSLLKYYIEKFGIENIASQFFRNKMIFLGFKNKENRSLINKIRRVANKYHKPSQLNHLLADDIYNANIWQLIKYYNLCTSYLNPTEDKLYQVRNGTNYLSNNKNYGLVGDVKRVVEEHYGGLRNIIESEIRDKLINLKDKIFIIPSYIDYKVPSSLKRLCSGVPEGSVINLPKDSTITIGVHWENIKNGKREERVDLDLHANSLNKNIGWYSNYKNDEVIYSGDITDASIKIGGASEALKFKNGCEDYVITLNNFTQSSTDVPYKFIIDFNDIEFKRSNRESNGYIFSQNVRTLNSTIYHNQNTLGFISDSKFYFINSSIFSGPITYNNDLLKRLIRYYNESQKNQLTFRQLADIVGFKIVDKLEDVPKIEVEIDGEKTFTYSPYTDLSLESITEDTFPRLFE